MTIKKLIFSLAGVFLVTLSTSLFAAENNLTILNQYGSEVKIVRASSDHDFAVLPKDQIIKNGKRLTISVVPKNSFWIEVGTAEDNFERVYVEYNDKLKNRYIVHLTNQTGSVCVKKIDKKKFLVKVYNCLKK